MKFNGVSYFSHEQKASHDAFTNATKFKSASFKSISAALTAAQKNQAVQLLLDLDVADHINRKVDWGINDFDLADTIRQLADHFVTALDDLSKTVDQFETLFPKVAGVKTTLQEYSGKVTEANYIEKVEKLLGTADRFRSSVEAIVKAQKFVKKDYDRIKEYQRFITAVEAELKKANQSDQAIEDAGKEFRRLYTHDMVENFAQLQQQSQIVKDRYFKLLKNAASAMTQTYQLLGEKVVTALNDLKINYPADLNQHNLRKLENLQQYCADRVVAEPEIEFSVTDKNSDYSLADMLNYSALATSKESELLMIQADFCSPEKNVKPEDPDAPEPPRKIHLQIPGKEMSVQEYKSVLQKHLGTISTARSDDTIEIDIQ